MEKEPGATAMLRSARAIKKNSAYVDLAFTTGRDFSAQIVFFLGTMARIWNGDGGKRRASRIKTSAKAECNLQGGESASRNGFTFAGSK